MTPHLSKLVQVAASLVLLAMSVLLWLPLGASSTHASSIYVLASSPTAVCPTPGNNACISNTPTVVLTLSGSNQTASYVLTFTLNNGTPGSWHVTITSTQFMAVESPTPGTQTLSTNASSVTAVTTVSACSGSTCPVNTVTPPVGWTANTPVTFFDNTGGGSHGQGTFTIQATINVLVPANIYTGKYTCTVTISFQSGP